MKNLSVLIALLFITACQQAAAPHPVIAAHVEAFNAGDVKAMSKSEHPDIEWLSINGSEVILEVKGRDALNEMMVEYLAENPSVKGTLRDWSQNGDYISVTETASWMTDKGEMKAQSSLSVYQMEDSLIRRVWYYPAVQD